MKITARSLNGKFDLGAYNEAVLKKHVRENPNSRYEIRSLDPESGAARGYYEGCLVALYCFYQEDLDHRNTKDHERAREIIALAFNSSMVISPISGMPEKIALSTKGRQALQKVSTELQEWLIDNYETPMEVLSPDAYLEWRDTIFPYGGPDNYISYCLHKGILKVYTQEEKVADFIDAVSSYKEMRAAAEKSGKLNTIPTMEAYLEERVRRIAKDFKS